MYVHKWLLVELHIKQTVIIISYYYNIKQKGTFGDFSKLHSSRHPTVMTMRPAADDGIETVLHGFESRLTRVASGRLLVDKACERSGPKIVWSRATLQKT